MFSSCPIAFNNPPPDGLASPIARVSKLFRPYCAFYIRLVAGALQHQIGDAPDVNFPGSCPAGYRAKVYVWLIRRASRPPAANQFHAAGKSAPKRQKP